VIDHVRPFRDWRVRARRQRPMCRTRWRRTPSEVEPVSGHPDRRRSAQVEHASPERVTPFCPHFGICVRAARSSTGKPSTIAHGSTISSSKRWRRQSLIDLIQFMTDRTPHRSRGRAADPARTDGHARGAQGGLRRRSSHDIIPVDRCPILEPGLSGALERQHGAGRATDLDRRSRSTSRSRRPTPASCRCAPARAAAGQDDRHRCRDCRATTVWRG